MEYIILLCDLIFSILTHIYACKWFLCYTELELVCITPYIYIYIYIHMDIYIYIYLYILVFESFTLYKHTFLVHYTHYTFCTHIISYLQENVAVCFFPPSLVPCRHLHTCISSENFLSNELPVRFPMRPRSTFSGGFEIAI